MTVDDEQALIVADEPLADSSEAESAARPRLSREQLGLLLAGGVVLGVAVAALMPRGTGRRLAAKGLAAAAAAGELGLALGNRAKVGAKDSAALGLLRKAADYAASKRRS